MGVIAVLAGLLLPAISSAREAARKVQCVSQLKQIGIALHSYHDQHLGLPPGWQWEATHQSAYGWSVPLLSFLEQPAVFRQTHRDRALSDPTNSLSRATSLAVFLCPSDISEPFFTLQGVGEGDSPSSMTPLVDLPTANYIGVYGTTEPDDAPPNVFGEGAFVESRSVRFAEFERGLSQTILIGERTMARIPSTWLGVDATGEDAPCRLVGNAFTSPNCQACDECEFASRHRGGSNFLWGDGHITLVSEAINSAVYQNLANRSAN